jgi:hypothetical protein
MGIGRTIIVQSTRREKPAKGGFLKPIDVPLAR